MALPDESTTSPKVNKVEPVDQSQILLRLTVALEALSQRQSASPDPTMGSLMETLSLALARVSETQLEGSKMIADETRRAARPSNQVVPGISVFNRRGLNLPDNATGPIKPKLKCIMMIPWLAEWESLTREEVELLNLVQEGQYVLARIDKSKVKINVHIDYAVDDVTPSRLVMTHDTAFNNDYFKLMPDLASYLRQILKQHDRPTAKKAAEILSDEEEEALIAAGDLTVSL